MNDSPEPKISFIVPVYNGEQFIARCLDAMLAELQNDDEVIVVDNGSTDSTSEIVASYPRVRLVHKPKGQIGAVRNAGAALATGDVLAFIDADCLLGPGWREAAVAGLTDATISGVGSRYALPDDPHWIEKCWFSQKRDSPALVSYINSGNLAIRSSVFHEVGGFNEVLETGEDAELGWRLTFRGYVLKEIPAVRAVHLGNPKNLQSFYRKQRWHGLGMFGTFRVSWFDKPLIMTFMFLACLVLSGVVLVLQGDTADSLTWLAVLAVLLLVPVLTAVYRCFEFHNCQAFPQLIILYLIYFIARVEAFARLFFRAIGLIRQGAA